MRCLGLMKTTCSSISLQKISYDDDLDGGESDDNHGASDSDHSEE